MAKKKKKPNIVSTQCCGASELQKYNMKGVILGALRVYLLTTSLCVSHHTDFTRGDKEGVNGRTCLCLLYTLTVFTLDHVVMFCFAVK